MVTVLKSKDFPAHASHDYDSRDVLGSLTLSFYNIHYLIMSLFKFYKTIFTHKLNVNDEMGRTVSTMERGREISEVNRCSVDSITSHSRHA